ncbi:MAG: Hsp20/alpha crystallin family protein [Fibrobacteria bacterium]|nr:Hsp20/alpha crystallin family protein [Fibrobacteria bacterium]
MLMNRSPWGELHKMRNEVDRLFNNSFQGGKISFPFVNLYDTDIEMLMQIELPGMSKDDITVTYVDGDLKVAGNRKPFSVDGQYELIRNERSTGAFERSYKLPVTVLNDRITADFANGVLTIKLPKAEEAKTKKIDVKVN